MIFEAVFFILIFVIFLGLGAKTNRILAPFFPLLQLNLNEIWRF